MGSSKNEPLPNNPKPGDKFTWPDKNSQNKEIDLFANAPMVSMQDSVIGGDVNYAPQVIHNTQNIINSNSQNDINNPTEDFSEVSNNAYMSGKKALQGLGIFILILIVSGLIGLAFDNPVSQNNRHGIMLIIIRLKIRSMRRLLFNLDNRNGCFLVNHWTLHIWAGGPCEYIQQN